VFWVGVAQDEQVAGVVKDDDAVAQQMPPLFWMPCDDDGG
jgi:hypothetical protein